MASKLHAQLEPFQATSSDEWDRAKVAHLLSRAAWGGTPEQIERFLELGPRRSIDELMDFPDGGADLVAQEDVPDLSQIEGYPKTFADRRKLYEGKNAEERQLIQQRLNQANQQALRAIVIWWMKQMVNGQYPLHEKLTFFWHGHFTTSARDERSAWLMWQQNETLRTHAAGNFGKFVKAISRDPAMLDYLNNQQNRKSAPNENYARELMELFTLGIGNYTEGDIKEVARAFTGWAHDGEGFIFRKYDHDDGVKTVFGRKGNFDGDDVIALILARRECATYIASRFWKFFVSDELDPAVVTSLGDVLRDSNYELRPMIRTLLMSRAFYAPNNLGAQIKSPVQLVVSTVRSLGVNVPDYGRLYGAMEQMGQIPLMPPNVKGWPGGRLWINTSTLFVRQNTALWLAGGSPITSGRRLMDRANRNQRNQPTVAVDVSGDAGAIVDDWVERLIQRPIDPSRREILIQAVGKRPTEESVRAMINLILSMPEYQLC